MEIENRFSGELVSTEHITVESLRQARKKKVLIKLLSVYGDDSSDEKGERIFAVAGVMGTQEEWDALEVDWIECTKGKIFHATDCEAGYKDYKGFSREQRLKEYKDLTKILAQSTMMGFGAAMDVDAYRTFMPDALDNAPYFHCFVRVVMYFTKIAYLHIPQLKIKFTFDINPVTRYNAAFLYDNCLSKRPEYKKYTDYMEEEMSFATRKTVGIQVADFVTKETMKHFDNWFGPKKRHTRLSMEELLKTNRYKFHYYDRDYFQHFKNNYADIENKSGIKREEYKEWLIKHNCLDNAENRTRYLIYYESIEASES